MRQGKFMDGHFVEVSHLRQYFLAGGWGKGRTYSRAVEDLSFYIDRGETLGLVGASGCGKTTAARTLLRLYEPMGGRFVFDGQVIFDVKNRQYAPMLPIRKRMQLVFQDPYASLNPRMTVGDIVGEGMDVHKMAGDKRKRQEQIMGMRSEERRGGKECRL